jgi:hypothetical protein
MTNKKTSFFDSLSDNDKAWLAGLYQGEAHFGYDKRTRSKIPDSNYTPPPKAPFIKLEMIEKDLMNKVGVLVDENVNLLKRRTTTTAGNKVYRTTLQKRAKVEAFLLSILPFVSGEKSLSSINEMLAVCDQYNEWLLQGGKTKAAQHAARARKYKKEGS